MLQAAVAQQEVRRKVQEELREAAADKVQGKRWKLREKHLAREREFQLQRERRQEAALKDVKRKVSSCTASAVVRSTKRGRSTRSRVPGRPNPIDNDGTYGSRGSVTHGEPSPRTWAKVSAPCSFLHIGYLIDLSSSLHIGPFGTGPSVTGGENLGCPQGSYVNRHHCQSYLSENDDDSQWAPTPGSFTPVPKGLTDPLAIQRDILEAINTKTPVM